jgi:hypothetical protein
MYGRLDTAEKRAEARKAFLKGYKVTEYPDADAVVGTTDRNGSPVAMGFTGTKGKPDFNYRFRTPEAREGFIARWLEDKKKTLAYKAERKAKKKAPALSAVPFKPGDILYNSWGYDQTNVDFYEVVEVKSASTIIIRPIAQTTTETCFMSGHTEPIPGEYTGEPITKRVQWYEGKPYIKFEFGCGSFWKGEAVSCSWYA